VLWVIAGLSVIAAAVSQQALQAATSTAGFADRAQAERDFAQARAELLFTLSTSGVVNRGRRVGNQLLRVDDHPYLAAGGSHLSVQDALGLMNLSRLQTKSGVPFLVGCGATPEQALRLIDTLADYVDADDLRRTQGGEAADYRQANLPAPRNSPLLSVQELWQVLGWAELRKSWEAKGCDDLVAVTNELGFNYTTAPVENLVANGFPLEVAQALVAERNAGAGQASVLAGNVRNFSIDENPFTGAGAATRPGNAYRVRHWREDGATLQYWVVLPQISGEPPWVLLDPVWLWDPKLAKRRATEPFPSRKPTDPTEDALAPPTANPFQ
jgi:hypothetical protein